MFEDGDMNKCKFTVVKNNKCITMHVIFIISRLLRLATVANIEKGENIWQKRMSVKSPRLSAPF